MAPRHSIIYDDENRPGYELLADIARNCGGWVSSSGGAEGPTAEVWHGKRENETRYTFRGRSLIDFLYACKDDQLETIYQAQALVEYIEKAAQQPPSVFVRDAIVGKARELAKRWTS